MIFHGNYFIAMNLNLYTSTIMKSVKYHPRSVHWSIYKVSIYHAMVSKLNSFDIFWSHKTNFRKTNNQTALTTVAEQIKSCKHLFRLDLSVNSLERLPDAITSLITLQELYLNDTFLEFLPANFGRLTNLRILELRDNNLMTLPKSIARLTNLSRIDIGNNEFTELVRGWQNVSLALWLHF